MAQRSLGEHQFERYLESRGYSWEYEPDLRVPTRPDYLVKREDGAQVVCEVKSFESLGLFAPKVQDRMQAESHAAGRPLAEALAPVRSQISKGAKQLRPLAKRGLPLIVVLTNPLLRPLPLSAELVISAMYGDAQYTVRPGIDQQPEWSVEFTRNGKLSGDHQYLSAVAYLREEPLAAGWLQDWWEHYRASYAKVEDALDALRAEQEAQDVPSGSVLCLDVIESVSSGACPIPPGWFSTDSDIRWTRTATGWVPSGRASAR